MSKSLGGEHCIYLDDNIETIKTKLKKAPTILEGIQNLKRIAKAFGVRYNEKQNAKSKDELSTAIHLTFIKQ